jgi:hypothetical protein
MSSDPKNIVPMSQLSVFDDFKSMAQREFSRINARRDLSGAEKDEYHRSYGIMESS